MFWRTGCVGCGRTCGGRQRRSEPERAGGERAGALGLRCFDGGACWKDGGRGGDQDREGGTAVGPGEAKDTGCEGRGAGDRDRTLSCSCPVQKSKNFVSRAQGALR